MAFHKQIRSLPWHSLLFTACVFLVFGCHRLLAMDFLIGDASGPPAWNDPQLWVGLLSDFWVAFLWTLVALLVEWPVRRFGRKVGWGFLPVLAVVVITALMHQTYVEFFRFQLIPFHVTYLADIDFVLSSLGTALNQRTIILSAIIFIVLGAGSILARTSPLSSRARLATWPILMILGFTSHKMNLHYKVQLFVPPELQVHYFERLYYHMRENPLPEALQPQEMALLSTRLQLNTKQPVSQWRKEAVRPALATAKPSQAALRLKRSLSRLKAKGRSPILITVLMESLRPSEVAAYQSSKISAQKPSITPHLDRLAKTSMVFTNAYATGTVTRGGQEAVWCGYLGSRNTSMMRNRLDVRVPCLPRLVADAASQNPERGGQSFWFHAGEGSFDNQEAFWRQEKVSHIMTNLHFEPETPKTPWGFSDKALFQASLKRLLDLRHQFPHQPLLGMILSLTHHIPWQLPADASEAMRTRAQQLAPPFATTMYSDAALGHFIEQLRLSPLWRESLLIVASDHGTAGTGYYPGPPAKPQWAKQKTHIVLMVAGGLVEAAGLQGEVVKQFVSQADIAPFQAWLLELSPTRFMGEMLFSQQRMRPVLADLGSHIYAPELDQQWERRQLVKSSAQGHLVSSYYRSFLQYLNQGMEKMKAGPNPQGTGTTQP